MCNLYCCFNRVMQLEWQLCASSATQEELCAWICNSVQDQISWTRSGPGPQDRSRVQDQQLNQIWSRSRTLVHVHAGCHAPWFCSMTLHDIACWCLPAWRTGYRRRYPDSEQDDLIQSQGTGKWNRSDFSELQVDSGLAI